jgi:hypothetical protein
MFVGTLLRKLPKKNFITSKFSKTIVARTCQIVENFAQIATIEKKSVSLEVRVGAKSAGSENPDLTSMDALLSGPQL